ncbi:MAG: ABC transporter substrate-binding protein, partial [Spirochaetales bacterium]|nr:ABC transporter substrate-binding protein [Spirochaetales bacterium]
MRKLTLIFIIIAMAVAAPLFAAGGKENAETAKVTIWHSAQGANATVFEEIAQTFNDTIGKEKGIEIEAIYQGKA